MTDASTRARRTPGVSAGYTLVELMLAMTIGAVILGAAITVAQQVTRASSALADGSAVQEEGQFAMDWITAAIRQAGSNPYRITTSGCPAVGTVFTPIRLDPLGTGRADNLRIHADVNPPNGLLGGSSGACTEAGEDVTIAHDPASLAITRRDNNVDQAAVPMSDGTITALRFTYLDNARVATTLAAQVAYVQVSITARAPMRDAYLGQQATYTLTSEVRIRLR